MILFEKEINGGVQIVHKFDNGYGASVIKNPYSYGGDVGLWEIAVLIFDGSDNYALTYDTEITSDVLGGLSEDEVQAVLSKIELLDKKDNK